MIETLNAAVLILDERARVEEANQRALDILGRERAGVVGADVHDLLHRRSDGTPPPRSGCAFLQHFFDGTPMQSRDAWFARADGTVVPVGWFMAPKVEDGRPTGALLAFKERARAGEADHETTELADRLSLIARTSTALTSTLDVDEALHRLVALTVPLLADWAVIDLLEDGALRRVAVVQKRGSAFVDLEEFKGPMPDVSEGSRMPLSRVLRGGPATLVGPEDYAGPPDSDIAVLQRKLFRALEMRSAVIAPLRGPRGVLGALTVARGAGRPPFLESDLPLVEDIALRAGLAVDNAQLYGQQQRVVESMQRHLLPPVPVIPGLEMTVRYFPAPHGSHVGGDWYDIFPTRHGATAIVVGDVMGHDLRAAAAMAQIRALLRGFAWTVPGDPGNVIDELDLALSRISDVQMATVILGRLEAEPDGSWHLRWANAGHPPPLLLSEGDPPRFVQDEPGVLLGTGLAPTRTSFSAWLRPGTTLALYTDGLVEAPGQPVEAGMRELARHAADLAHLPLDGFCDRLVEAARPGGHVDDVALLVLRVPQEAPATPGGDRP